MKKQAVTRIQPRSAVKKIDKYLSAAKIKLEFLNFRIYKNIINKQTERRKPKMEVAKIKRNYQLTIPRSVRKKMKLAIGDYVEIDVKENQVIIRPLKLIHPDQEYFYTKEWQDKEAEADRDIEKGDLLGPFENAQDALETLKKAKP